MIQPIHKTIIIDNPKVSVIIASYNYSNYLSEAVDSALSVRGVECEVIVVDDGSTDDTSKVVQSYQDRIRYIYQENQGLSAARNTGIRESRGELLVFLDADDALNPDMVQHSLKALNKLGDSFAVIGHTPDRINSMGEPILSRRPSLSEDVEITLFDLLITSRFPPTALVRKTAFTELGFFDTELKACEDRDMWIRIARRHQIWCLGSALSSRRIHGTNMSSNALRQAASIRQVHKKAWKEDYLVGAEKFYWLKIKSFYFAQHAMMLGSRSPFSSLFRLLFSIVLWWCFLDRKKLKQPLFFRIRLGIWIIRKGLLNQSI
jgi:glycosyltransferase involved in cell wall biosynthesis